MDPAGIIQARELLGMVCVVVATVSPLFALATRTALSLAAVAATDAMLARLTNVDPRRIIFWEKQRRRFSRSIDHNHKMTIFIENVVTF